MTDKRIPRQPLAPRTGCSVPAAMRAAAAEQCGGAAKAGSPSGVVNASPANTAASVTLCVPAPPPGAPPPFPSRSASSERRTLERAEALAAAGQVDRALEQLRRLVARMPDSLRGRLRMATLLRERNRPAEALDVLRTCVRRSPRSLPPREMLAELCLETGGLDEAVQQCRALLTLSPNSLLARDILSAAYLQHGYLTRALRVIDEMIRLDPQDAGNHFKRGVLMQQMGNVGAAVVSFQRSLEMAPDSEAADESRSALELLDGYQIRQIITLAVEDLSFRILLRQDAARAVAAKGYSLSNAGMNALAQMRFDNFPDAPPGWRHLCYQ